MLKRDEFIAFINRLKAVSPSITDEQRKGLLRQATQEHEISVAEAVEILKESGLIVGESKNYFEVLNIPIEELQNRSEDVITAHIDASHQRLYTASLRAGGLPRSDGRTQEHWRTLLNQARDTLIDPQKRREHLAMLQRDEQEALLEIDASPIFKPSDAKKTNSQELSHQIVPNDIDVPAGMMYIPEGEFQMGSNDEEANEDEQPVHTVFLDVFFMDKHPVTNSEFKKFVNANPGWQKPGLLFESHIPTNYHDGGYLSQWENQFYQTGKEEHPVVGISWYAAMAYAQWIGKRLPTEAEWEKAARGGLQGKNYPWGDFIDSNTQSDTDTFDDTMPVGYSGVNGYGLYDLSGNVWEWCLDAYDADFYAHSQHRNPFSDENRIGWIVDYFTRVKSSRVLRGGPWGVDAQGARVSQRFSSSPIDTLPTFGFRCVMDIISN